MGALQLVAALALAGVVLVSTHGQVREAHDVGRPGAAAACVLGIGLVGEWLVLLGCLLALRDVVPRACRATPRTAAGRRLVWAGLGLLFIQGVLSPVVNRGAFAEILGPLNNQILLAGVAILTIHGLVGIVGMRGTAGDSVSSQGGDAQPSRGRWPRLLAAASVAGIAVAAVAFAAMPSDSMRTSIQAAPPIVKTGDWPEWGGGTDRNMVSGERGLPVEFDEARGANKSDLKNVKWVVRLTNQTLASPIVHQGKVLIGGTGDDGDGILWCFAEADGKLLWRMKAPYVAKLYNRSFGICAPPTADDGRLYLVTHLGDVLCLNADGMTRGNQGPFTDEAKYFATDQRVTKRAIAPDGSRIVVQSPGEPAELTETDADILWRFDMIREVNCWPYNALNSAPLVRGDRLYVATGSTLSRSKDGETSSFVRAWKGQYNPDRYPSPALIVLDKNTGKLLARENVGIFEGTFHGAHSSPALGKINGKELLIYGGGDGTCYAFDPDFSPGPDGQPGDLKLVWKFD